RSRGNRGIERGRGAVAHAAGAATAAGGVTAGDGRTDADPRRPVPARHVDVRVVGELATGLGHVGEGHDGCAITVERQGGTLGRVQDGAGRRTVEAHRVAGARAREVTAEEYPRRTVPAPHETTHRAPL